MIIKAYASLGPEYLYELGISSGMTEDAANYFRYLSEIEVDIKVDAETGKVLGVKIPSRNSGKGLGGDSQD